jgi:hypothetical protein
MAALTAAYTKDSILNLLNENGGNELQALITAIQTPATTQHIAANLPLIEAIQPALLLRGRAVAAESSMTYREAADIFSREGYKARHSVLERLFSPQDRAFDNIHSLAGIVFFEAQLALRGNDAQIRSSTQILEDCMSHLQTFVYPLRFTKYTGIGLPAAPPPALATTYGPATSSKPDVTAIGNGYVKYTATPEASYRLGATAVDNMDMWQFPPNCLYQSQIKMREGYSEGTTFAIGFRMGDIMSENCIVKTFVLSDGTSPTRNYPFDTSNMKVPSGYNIYIRRSDSMAIFVDANGRAVREIPISIVMKLPTTNRFNNDICNNAIGNYVGSMTATPMTVVNITSDANTVNITDAVFPAERVLGVRGLPGQIFISDIDIRQVQLAQIYQPYNLMALRMCARIAFWRYRAIKPSSKGGSNKMMITNMSNKTRNMTKRQRRSKSKSKSKSKSMSMLKSAKRTFYRTNKRNKTSRYH